MTINEDCFGNPIEVGDIVKVIEPSYRNLITARITAFTPARVRVEYIATGRSKPSSYLTCRSDIIKAPKEYLDKYPHVTNPDFWVSGESRERIFEQLRKQLSDSNSNSNVPNSEFWVKVEVEQTIVDGLRK